MPGWMNLDNSPTVMLAQSALLVEALGRVGVLKPEQVQFGRVARAQHIRYANVARAIPLPTACADVVYSSHMVEHLDQHQVVALLREVFRVLKPQGIFRVVVPDLKIQIERYQANHDANAFVAGTYLGKSGERSLIGRLRRLALGSRDHAWMYDGASLSRVLENAGFVEARILPPGQTLISDPGDLDLREREDESVYVESRRPVQS